MTDTRTPDASPGDLIGGRYRLDAEIGRGGMAVVHRGRDLVLERDVAVKLFRSDVATAGDPRRIKAEMQLLASVNSPALVTLHDASAGGEGVPPYLVMELVDGQDLATALPYLSVGEVVEVARQVAIALAHVHARGIVHRDVKPANILVFREHDRVRAKLADLGIARLMDGTRITAAGAIVGTVGYLSPEQVLGRQPGPASDVYALGLLLIESLTSAPAFPGTRAETLAARTARPPDLPDGLHPADAALLAGMTALDPGARVDALAAEAGLHSWSSPGPFRRTTPAPESLTSLTATQPGLPPTQVLPAAPAAERATAELAQSESSAGELIGDGAVLDSPAPRPGRRRRAVLLGAVALVLTGSLAAAAVLTRQDPPEAPAPAPTYPVVEGDLGIHLGELQDSVRP
ncbi:MAG: serine/threonine protein kinase [Naasia sp.]|uniref:serine/threonine-protein kinase n=1 Tax=Naasia sp. TaxID=2546198 RepID=UPI00262B45E6|nr:serine/threonine-protein kinase [Naasia sp.]MCU1571634.1 serine/threonine protein kinase [Naasia sp.]